MADQDSNLGKATPDTVLSDWHNVWHMLPTWQTIIRLLILIETGQHLKDVSKDHPCATFLPMHCDAVKPLKGYSDHESVTCEPTQATNNRL